MKRFALVLFLLVSFVGVSLAARPVRVKGGVTKSGTYRRPHYRTAPNKSKSDNWSTKGNSNPYTGKKGSKKVN